jgi:transcriptional regulator with XRE-family HTH domain
MKDTTPVQSLAPHPIQMAREALTPPLSREGLAFRAGVSFKTIERIERGGTRPHRLTLKAIADVLGMDPDDLAERRRAA